MWLQACPIYLHVYLGSLYILKPPVIITSYGKLGIHIGSLHAHTHVTKIHIYAWEILPKKLLSSLSHVRSRPSAAYRCLQTLFIATSNNISFPPPRIYRIHSSWFFISQVLCCSYTTRYRKTYFWYMDSMSTVLFEGYIFIVYLIQQLALFDYKYIQTEMWITDLFVYKDSHIIGFNQGFDFMNGNIHSLQGCKFNLGVW